MDKSFLAENVDASTVLKLSAQYPYVAPESLLRHPKYLDKYRYDMGPELLRQRRQKPSEDQKPYINKDDLVKLMDWKLGHGKFRPNLPKLIQQNSPSYVHATSEAAFEIYDDPHQESIHAFEKLESLRGVGPATASLVLSMYDPENVPFFSDELYRWCFWYTGKGLGWDRRISYSWKQYFDFQYQIEQWLKRLHKQQGELEKSASSLNNDIEKKVGCIELERAAFVLAKTDGKGFTDEEVARLEAGEEVKGVKRKLSDNSEESGNAEHVSVSGVIEDEPSTNGVSDDVEIAKRKAKKPHQPRPAKKQKVESKSASRAPKECEPPNPSLRRSARNRQRTSYADDDEEVGEGDD